jgi:hypothetical protein
MARDSFRCAPTSLSEALAKKQSVPMAGYQIAFPTQPRGSGTTDGVSCSTVVVSADPELPWITEVNLLVHGEKLRFARQPRHVLTPCTKNKAIEYMYVGGDGDDEHLYKLDVVHGEKCCYVFTSNGALEKDIDEGRNPFAASFAKHD